MGKFSMNGSTASKPRGTRKCPICSKHFSSGRAFGGHWRHHMQQARSHGRKDILGQRTGDKLEAKKANERRPFNKATAMMNHDQDRCNKIIYCCLCDKKFCSLRSLSGHMRSHPNRARREIDPPVARLPNSVSSTSSKGTSENVWNEDYWSKISKSPVDLLEYLPRSWSKTDKRGRKSNVVAAAADSLINLARGRSGKFGKQIGEPSPPLMSEDGSATKLKIKPASCRGALSKISTTYDQQEKEGIKDLKGKKAIITDCDVTEKKTKNVSLGEKKRYYSITTSSSTETDENVYLLRSTAAKTHNKIDNTTNWYKCSSCEKSFATFQGLGGHRSIHIKNIVSTPSVADKENTTCASDTISKLPTQLADSSPEIASSSRGFYVRGGQSGRTLLDFDLNELPFGMA